MKTVIFNSLQTSLSGGIGRYSYELSKAIYNRHDINFKIIIREEDSKLYEFVDKNDLIVLKNIKNSKDRNLYEQLTIPKYVNKEYPGAILHYPDTMAPLFSNNQVVITIHDLAFKSVKGAFNLKSKLWKNFITDLSVKKANKIICDTDFSKSEVIRYYGEKVNDKIDVVYLGFNNFSNENIDVNNIRKELKNIKKNYILTVSTISPRKNMDGLIKAFNLIKCDVDCNLVIAGKRGWLYDNIFKLVDDLKLNNRIIFTDQVNDDELKYLYKNSKIFVYPSFYEGFGLPPLEAMSYGIPCIVSNCTSLPEVVNKAAILINPSDVKSISEKILHLLNSYNMCNDLINDGYENIKKFSWESCACNTISIYKKL